jgi:hypothetical protein
MCHTKTFSARFVHREEYMKINLPHVFGVTRLFRTWTVNVSYEERTEPASSEFSQTPVKIETYSGGRIFG